MNCAAIVPLTRPSKNARTYGILSAAVESIGGGDEYARHGGDMLLASELPLTVTSLASVSDGDAPLLADPGGTLRADLRIRGLPGVAFVGSDGSVQVEFGVVDSYAELRAMTQKHLDVTLPS